MPEPIKGKKKEDFIFNILKCAILYGLAKKRRLKNEP